MQPILDLEKEYGLVLEGGGGKGAYQIGAWKALREVGVKIKGVAGTSVGALNGAMICMDNMDRAVELWENIAYSKVMDVNDEQMQRLFARDIESDMLKEVLKDALRIVADRGADITPLKRLIAENVDEEKIRKSPMDFFCCTYSITDRKELEVDMKALPDGQMQDMLLASAYLPVFKNEKLHGKTYTDGGRTNVLPVNTLVNRGYEDVILLRIFGRGHVKRFEIPEHVNVYEIAPKVSLGSILQFDAQKSRRNLKVGYYDAKRLIYGLAGKIYYIEESGEECYYLEKLLQSDPEAQRQVLLEHRLPEDSDKRLRILVENLFPLMAEELKLGKNWTYKELYLSMLEATARKYRVPKYEIYTPESLLECIQKKAAKAEREEICYEFKRTSLFDPAGLHPGGN